MSTARRAALLATAFAATLTVAMADVPAPPAVRIALGVLIVFLLPGFAILCAVQSSSQVSRTDGLLASLGISLAITAITSVVVAATPIGLSRGSIAAVLGGITALVSIYAFFHSQRPSERGGRD